MLHSKKPNRVVIKIGSSSLTSLHGEVSRKKLEKLVDQVVALKDEGMEVVLVSSGAVAAGYRKLGFIERPSSLPEKQAAASIGQGLLMESYSELFLSHGYVASQILITRTDFSNENRYYNMSNTINVLLERGIIPIVNENDTVTVDRLKFGDNDTLSAKVAALINADQLMILSDIDGLYTDNPSTNPDAKMLEHVTEITESIEAAAGDSGSAVGTGGMKSKIDAVKISMASGISTFLGKADIPDILIDAVNGNAHGTYFENKPESANLDRKRQWIAFNSGPEGKIIIHKKAKEALLEGSKSLYSGDVKEVKGKFENGAVVKIGDDSGEEIGVGVVNYSTEQLQEGTDGKKKAIIDREAFVCYFDFCIPASL
ncbi:glutamate 5-kinase [Fictibacillus aquaticus]|uniref:Glutamate 5-kinase n=1 Tax=Fictibacillus aquaticus TaxID=2021314 RepID=A0A235FE97_9BACL|nr:glutamate 5-kinase [Fictibacillus aquaticus]OYD59264.1 glutamate 5-kinase [Fictibacillus aquaticus]